MLQPYSPIALAGPAQALQSHVARAIEPLLSRAHADHLLLENIPLTAATTTLIEHGLGHEPRGWHLVRLNAGAMVWEQTADTTARYLALRCSDTCTVSVLVF